MKTAATISQAFKDGAHTLSDLFSRGLSNFQQADLSIFHQFAPPPSGGGHQFLRALRQETVKRGLLVENNTISHTTRACLFNSFNFDERRLRHLHRDSVMYVHRVDGPIDVYRGKDNGIDLHIWSLNQEFVDKTIFQSQYSLEKHLALGMKFKNPVVSINAVDATIFNRNDRISFSRNRKIRLIASSWSDNANKGSAIYAWLDRHLDWDRFEFVFVGRSPVRFQNIKMVDPVPSPELANFHRINDIYITASRYDPCSNSLLEALGCGLPALYLKSGGHPEIVKTAGLGFDSAEEIPALLEQMVSDYEQFQSRIDIPSIQDVTTFYLKTMELI